MPHLMISAGHKSSGKTTITLGLCAALKAAGLVVQPFKKGPDYIDPMWLSLAAERDCHNLDFHSMSKDELRGTFRQYGHDADICLIEGNKGLYDGLDLEGRNSNAALARLIKAPVILVIDAQGMTRGIAPLILGYQAFDKRVSISGVILNKLGGKRHEGKLRAVIEYYTDVPVIGAVHKSDSLIIKEQHLGLIPSANTTETKQKINEIAKLISDQVDLEKIHEISATSAAIKLNKPQNNQEQTQRNLRDPVFHDKIRIGIARDTAFGFYYPSDLMALKEAGAELITINTFNDQKLPSLHGLFIGGGFPENYMAELSKNKSLKTDIANAIENGLPVYAECGGLMYLTRGIRWNGDEFPMVGAIQADTEMCKTPQGRGYVRLKETESLWPIDENHKPNKEFCAHEFHYSRLINLHENVKFAYKVLRGAGITGSEDGIIYKNVLASYSHLRDVSHNHWAKRFVDFVRQENYHQTVSSS